MREGIGVRIVEKIEKGIIKVLAKLPERVQRDT